MLFSALAVLEGFARLQLKEVLLFNAVDVLVEVGVEVEEVNHLQVDVVDNLLVVGGCNPKETLVSEAWEFESVDAPLAETC